MKLAMYDPPITPTQWPCPDWLDTGPARLVNGWADELRGIYGCPPGYRLTAIVTAEMSPDMDSTFHQVYGLLAPHSTHVGIVGHDGPDGRLWLIGGFVRRAIGGNAVRCQIAELAESL